MFQSIPKCSNSLILGDKRRTGLSIKRKETNPHRPQHSLLSIERIELRPTGRRRGPLSIERRELRPSGPQRGLLSIERKERPTGPRQGLQSIQPQRPFFLSEEVRHATSSKKLVPHWPHGFGSSINRFSSRGRSGSNRRN